MDTPKITVISIVSCSYTGTTWLNMVLGCHERALALGPFDHVHAQLKAKESGVCKIHGDACSLWPRFLESYSTERNLFVQLAEATGKSVFVINNPQMPCAELDHPDIRLRTIVLYRDGRAVSASFHRKFPGKYSADDNYSHVVKEWWAPAANGFVRHLDSPDAFVLVYEELVEDLESHLGKIGDHVGLDYASDAQQYWTYEQHMAGGSGGPVFLAAKMQGQAHDGDQGNDEFYDFYRGKVDEVQTKPLNDDRWRTELTRRDLFVFDCLAGEANARVGYERDRFTDEECRQFGAHVDRLQGKSISASGGPSWAWLMVVGLFAASVVVVLFQLL